MIELKHQQEVEGALRLLEAHAFASVHVKALWRELTERVGEAERGVPGEDDVRYVLPEVAPTILEHFLEGGNPVLDMAKAWNGFSYSLTPGMRGLLRDLYELTPTQTVTLAWVEPWPGTRHPYRMKLVSDIHVDPRLRKHVLTEVVVNKVGEFFRLAAERDAELKDRVAPLGEAMLVVGRIVKLASEYRWACEDLCGVKVGDKCEVIATSKERFSLACLKTGNVANVPRNEFFETAEEYVKAYAVPKTRKPRATVVDVTPELDKLIASLM